MQFKCPDSILRHDCEIAYQGMFAVQATKHLADMAACMPRLKSFVHVSTAYVNGNQPKGSTVAEIMLPLPGQADKAMHHAELVTSLQALTRPQAALQARLLLTRMLCAHGP